MDPLSALSIAAAVAQFIDFTLKFLSITYGIYNSAKGRLSDNIKAEEIYKELARISYKLTVTDADPIL